MATGDLTTLANLKAYAPGLDAGGADTTYDALLARLISSVSDQFRSETGTNPKQTTYTEVRDGNGLDGLSLLNWPVISVTSVKVDGSTIPQRSTVADAGWVLTNSGRLKLVGYTFTAGVANVEVVYSAGYQTVPSDIEQAVIKMVALQFADRKRIGLNSLSQAGGSVSFGDAPVLAYWRSVVENYRLPAI